jgi:hypothetical protein
MGGSEKCFDAPTLYNWIRFHWTAKVLLAAVVVPFHVLAYLLYFQ